MQTSDGISDEIAGSGLSGQGAAHAHAAKKALKTNCRVADRTLSLYRISASILNKAPPLKLDAN
jgi:hypothetical protein